jgi:membrane protein DedA with SNARE-associated domain
MNPYGEAVARYGYLLLFGYVLLQQLGLPLPASPVLLAAGALARAGQVSLAATLAVTVSAASAAHLVWYQAGRLRGASVLALLCRISLEPDTCVRKTENLFTRFGAKLLVFAPFIPGLGLVAPPLAGLSGMRLLRFLLIDGLGSLLWASCIVGAGYALGPQLAMVLVVLRGVGGSVLSGALLLLAGYLAWKLIDRKLALRRLRIDRITPQELQARIARGEPLFIVDMRHELEMDEQRRTLPGALHLLLEELEDRHTEIPRDRDIALFCS